MIKHDFAGPSREEFQKNLLAQIPGVRVPKSDADIVASTIATVALFGLEFRTNFPVANIVNNVFKGYLEKYYPDSFVGGLPAMLYTGAFLATGYGIWTTIKHGVDISNFNQSVKSATRSEYGQEK